MVDDVSVKFGADTSAIKAATGDIRDQLGQIKDSGADLTSAFKDVGAAFLEAFAVEKIADFIEKITQVGENIERISAMTGVSNGFVQTLGFAMERTGGSAEAAGMMITRLERNIEEAASGTGKAYEGFQKLGVSLHDLQTSSIDELIEKTANGFKNLDDAVERAAVATQIGGRGFAQMLPALMESADGLASYRAKLIELNDYLSDKTVKALADTHGAFIDLQRAIQGAGVEALMTFKGAIDGLLIDITDAIVVIGKIIGYFRELQTVLGADLVIACGLFVRAIQDLGAQAGYAADKLIIRWKEVGAVISEVATLHWSEISSVQTEANAEIAEAAKKATIALQTYQKEYDNLKTSATNAAASILAADKAITNPTTAGSTHRGTVVPTADTTGDEDFLNAVKQNMEDLKTLDEVNKKTTEDYQKDWNSAFNTVDRALDGMLQGVLQGTQTLQQAMAKLFDNLALTAIEDIAKIMVKWAAFQAMKAISPGSQLTNSLGGMVPQSLGGTQGVQQSAQIIALQANTAALTAYNATLAAGGTIAEANTAAINAGAVVTATNTTTTGVNTTTQNTGIIAWLDNTIATIANTVATDAGDVGKLMGFDVGTASLPFTGPILAHKGEMILPPDISAAVRSGNMTVGAGPLGAGAVMQGGGSNFNITIQAIDTQTGAAFLKNNAGVIAAAVASQTRNGNSSLTSLRAA